MLGIHPNAERSRTPNDPSSFFGARGLAGSFVTEINAKRTKTGQFGGLELPAG
jgi:hypothetical protein